ncbi:MAG: acyl-CoA dehydrogenase, partial [Myxococcales bacterium]|nr:acyl-CoA dehydrogenase [Myxococcales bacterium]
LRVLNWRVAWGIETGNLDPADASAVKVLGTEFFVEAYKLLLEIVGPRGTVRGGASASVEGLLEWAWRAAFVMTFGGGTNEIQRDIIAQVGLKMPRSDR